MSLKKNILQQEDIELYNI